MRDRASSKPETRDGLIGYDEINRLAKERGKTVSDLIALTSHNDPFYAEQAGRVVAAKWFAEQYEREKFKAGVHVRRIHYRLVSRESQKDWLGRNYLNTTSCWQALLAASKDARYLGTVPLADFDDRRNPTAIATGVDLPRDPKLKHASVDASGLNLGGLVLPSLYIDTADRPAQPYHCEIWCEKSTMRDILDLIGARYGVTRVYSLGEISLTACVKLILERVARNGDRPIRILYLSDFDPAGKSIPVAAARKIEWLIKKNNLDVDLQLIPILLDHDQCVHYRLPRTPIKEGEGRADEWAIRFGEGGTELDALEALHPGELHRIVTEALDRYHDHDLQGRWNALLIERRRAIGAIAADVRREYAAALSPYRAERDRLAWEVNDLRQKVRLVFAKMIEDISDRTGRDILDPLLEFVSEREIIKHPDPLFDSTRDYEEQIARYKLFQGKDEAFDMRRRAKRASKERERRAGKKAKRAAGMPETRAELGGAL
jgi:hypothetical protein